MAQEVKIPIILGFTANTKDAQTQMRQLEEELDRLSQLEIADPMIKVGDKTKDARQELSKLKLALKDSFNVDTGKLDLNRFSVQAKKLNLDIDSINKSLITMGGEFSNAQTQLSALFAQGTSNAVYMNKALAGLYDQMVRTAKLQFSYTALRAITNTFTDAVRYAEELNESLNNIRIVTGYSSDKMADFAKEASAAAKALSTTTTAYTDASLIYYQQGLSDQQVVDRTNVTVKLANVTKQSAEEVSSYMTAIWNNFAKGSDDLERYADIITKLGAATAASSEEIATGLSHFSAVADTVGLSYEYATAALATVVAQTRQSADTVGNSFKTIFARLESLKMGESLEDGTGLTKYSEALAAVGVNIKQGNGDLKRMDDILDELGAKWSTLNQESKSALANTVAGTRQYTNFIALMDNYDKVKQNVNLAMTADGTLEEQAEIFAESWEASAKRVKASMEELYNKVLNDKVFIAFNNAIADGVSLLSKLVDGFGGLKSIVAMVLPLFVSLFGGKIIGNIRDMGTTISSLWSNIKGDSAPWQQYGKHYMMAEQKAMYEINSDYEEAFMQGLANEQKLRDRAETAGTPVRLQEAYIAEADAYDKITTNLSQFSAQLETLGNDRLKLSYQLTSAEQLEDMKPELGDNKKKNKKKQKAHIAKVSQFLEGQSELLDDADKGWKQQLETYKTVAEKYNYINEVLERQRDLLKENLQTNKDTTQAIKEQADAEAEKLQEYNEAYDKKFKTEETVKSVVQLVTQLSGAAVTFSGFFNSLAKGEFNVTQLVSSLSMLSAITLSNKKLLLDMASGILTKFVPGLQIAETGIKSVAIAGGTALALVAAFTVAFKLFSAAWEWYKSQQPEEKLKKLKEETQAAAEKADEASAKYNNLSSSLQQLTNNAEGFKSLTKYSVEWFQALTQNNNAIIELLKNYDLLTEAGMYFIDENGFMILTEAGIERLNNKTLAELKSSQVNYYEAQINENEQKRANTAAGIGFDASKAGLENTYAAYQYDPDTTDWSTTQTSFTLSSVKTTDIVTKVAEAMRNGKQDFSGGSKIANAELSKLFDGQTFYIDDDQWKNIIQAANDINASVNETNQELALLNNQKNQFLFGDLVSQYGYSADILTDPAFQKFIDNATTKNYTEEERKQDLEAYLKNLYGDQYDASKFKGANGVYSYGDETFDITDDGDDLATILSTNQSELKDIIAAAINAAASDSSFSAEKYYLTGDRQFANESTEGIADKEVTDHKFDEKSITAATEALVEQAEAAGGATEKELQGLRYTYHGIVVDNAKLNDGLKDLIGNFKNYSKTIKNNNAASTEYQKALKSLKNDVSLLLGVTENDISTSLITENLDMIEDIVAGNFDRIAELSDKFIKDYSAKIYSGMDEKIKKELELSGNTVEYFNDLMTQLNEAAQNAEFGDSIVDMVGESSKEIEQFFNALLTSGAMTAEQIMNIFDSIGIEVALTRDKDGTIKGVDIEKSISKGPISSRISASNKESAGSGSAKEKKNLIDEKTRYYEINQQLTSLNNNLDKISKNKDRAFGKSKIKAMEDELAVYEQLAKAQEKYYNEAKSYLQSDMSALAAYGAKFNNDGTLANYDQLISSQVDAYNASLSDEAEKTYEDFKKALSNYEDSLSKVQSESLALIEATNKIYNAKLEKISYQVEYKIHIDDRDIQYLEWLVNQLDESTYDVAEAIGILTKQAADTENKFNTIMNGLNEWRNGHTEISESAWNNFMAGQITAEEMAQMFTTITAGEKDQLEQWADDLMSVSDALKDISQSIQDKVIAAFDNFNTKVVEQTDNIAHLNEIMGVYKDIINLLGLEMTGVTREIVVAMDQSIVEMARTTLDVNKTAFAEAKTAWERVKDSALDENTKKEIYNRYKEMETAYIQSLESALQASADAFTNTLQGIVDDFNKKMGGVYGTLSNLKDAFNKANTLDNLYLDTYRQTYELAKLTRNINKSINDTNVIKGKQLLANVMDEINTIQDEGRKINEYDLNILQRKYELYLAQIALEEAQNAKSQVRMSRDSEGNMSYVYTADANAIQNAQQTYDDKLYNLEKTTQDRIDSIQNMILTAMEQYINEISQLNISDQERVDLINSHYAELQETYGVFLNQAITDADWIVKELQVDEKELINSFDETTFAHVYNIQTMDEFNQLYYETTSNLIASLEDNYRTFTENTSDLTAELEGAIQDHLNRVNEETTQAGEIVTNMADDFSNAFDKAMDAADLFNRKYASVMNNIKESTKVAVNALNTLLAAMAETGQGNYKSDFKLDDIVANANAQTAQVLASGKGNQSPGAGPKKNPPDEQTYTVTLNGTSVTKKASELSDYLYRLYPSNMNKNITVRKDGTYGLKSGIFEALFRHWGFEPFASGGYTGAWGPSGKLAMLHEKELVLNKEDTKNILGTVSAVRDLYDSILNQGINRSFSIPTGAQVSGIMGYGDQNITINADFPNATSRDEIQAAFKELALSLSQYTYKKA